MALAGVASADITDGLQWAESFGDGYSQAATFGLTNSFYVENGVGVAGGDHTDSRVWTTNTGGKFTNAFTFSFKMVDLDAAAWADAVSIYTNGTTSGTNNSLQLQKDASGNLMMYTENFTSSNVAGDDSNINLGSVDSLKGKVLTLVLDATGSSNTLTAYVGGTALTDTVTFTYADGVTASTALTGFQFGAAFGDQRASTSVTVDDIAVWNRALTAEEVATLPLVVAGSDDVVPEPATATLSLLALAGLAARRRRR
jgi:MYXO-CTERM domain-containing protein